MSQAHENQHDEHDHHDGDVNIGLLVTISIAGILFLVAFLFFMVGFFDYMAYQGRLEKVINVPAASMEIKVQQTANLYSGAEIRIDDAMSQVVQEYKSAKSSD